MKEKKKSFRYFFGLAYVQAFGPLFLGAPFFVLGGFWIVAAFVIVPFMMALGYYYNYHIGK